MRKRFYQINHFKKNPEMVQEKVFKHLINKGTSTFFGKKYNFSEILNFSDFSKYVPLHTYEDLFPYINKLRIGKQNILWPDKIKWFAKSSGTTNDKSKYIPISYDSLYECHYKAGKDMLSLYCNNYPDTQIYNGKSLMLGGSQIYNEEYDFCDGDLSAILINNFPFWVSMHRVPDLNTALLSDWERKLNLIVKKSIKENVTNITGVPSWILVLLEKVLEETSAKNIIEVWPNLELYMHGGVHFGPYKSQFHQIIPSDSMNYIEGYNASEGFFAIQDQRDSKDLLLMLDYGIFYEFITLKDYNKGIEKTIMLSEVLIGEIYVIVISTNSGLWRYIIGDTIRFTSKDPYRIRVVGRTKSYINAFGEELIVENAEDALSICCEQYNCVVENFIVAPMYLNSGSGFHKWIIEFKIPPESIDLFGKELDKTLKTLNSDYEAKRTDSLVMKELEIIVARENLFYSWLSKYNRLGGQYKVPRLDHSSKIFSEILDLNNAVV